ncbi:MAG: hypothetical protein LBU38_04980 [Propionibacteriaceae bacterium]|nr:hypothetical protein [Propionibacteriaceae bacterium]
MRQLLYDNHMKLCHWAIRLAYYVQEGVNAQLREVARRHRGMPVEHRRRAFEWWMWRHAAAAPPLADLIRPEHFKEPPNPKPHANDDKPGDWGTAATPEEGL